jgi:flagellar basal-body rod modification protein FlgD
MNINDVGALQGPAANSTRTQTPANSSNQVSEERDLFLKLLVAQLKNQDPLAPQDGAQFVAQLAQINTVDQLVSIRQILEQLASPPRVAAAAQVSNSLLAEPV